MTEKMTSQKPINRRLFLLKVVSSVSFFSVSFICSKLFTPDSAIAQDDQPPQPPGLGKSNSDKKDVYETEITKHVREVTKKWDENNEKYRRHLSPSQKEEQRKEIEKAILRMVESKGYDILPPNPIFNLRVE